MPEPAFGTVLVGDSCSRADLGERSPREFEVPRMTFQFTFEWDARKAAANAEKHGVTFDEALSAFSDPLSRSIPDPDHSTNEDRFLLLGLSASGRLLAVAHTERADRIRLISARLASKRERRSYEET